jgi:Carboxypeptidase regulatory-like domain
MMTKKKTKKKRFDPLFDFFRHPASPFGHLTFVRLTIALLGMVLLAGAAFIYEPAGGAQNSSGSHAHVYLIFATVFTDQGFALPGARARVRRMEEKKFRWEAASDHQGEMAFRVPPGAEYEMTVEARGFKTQTRKIDARQDNRADLSIRMEPQTAPLSEPGTGGKP